MALTEASPTTGRSRSCKAGMISGDSTFAVLLCDCKSEFQDAIYGKRQRFHNKLAACKIGGNEFRCTVCGKKRGR